MNKLEQFIEECKTNILYKSHALYHDLSHTERFSVVSGKLAGCDDLELLELVQSKLNVMRHMTVNHSVNNLNNGISIREVIIETLADYIMFQL